MADFVDLLDWRFKDWCLLVNRNRVIIMFLLHISSVFVFDDSELWSSFVFNFIIVLSIILCSTGKASLL